MDASTIAEAADPTGAGSVRRPTLMLDVSLYEEFLADRDLTEDQKRALLEALWTIIVGFVDLGFTIEPANTPPDNSREDSGEFASAGFALVDSSITSTSPFARAAGPAAAGDQEEIHEQAHP